MQTQGSETSQYLEENRTIVISLVAASEKERAQTDFFARKNRGYKMMTQLILRELKNVMLGEVAGTQRQRR